MECNSKIALLQMEFYIPPERYDHEFSMGIRNNVWAFSVMMTLGANYKDLKNDNPFNDVINFFKNSY